MPALNYRRVGHKGADHIAPGNTLASFDAALAAGVDMVEFDVLRLADGRPKTVRWWRMAVVEDLGSDPDDEVDGLRWVTPGEALALLSYEQDKQLVRSVT